MTYTLNWLTIKHKIVIMVDIFNAIKRLDMSYFFAFQEVFKMNYTLINNNAIHDERLSTTEFKLYCIILQKCYGDKVSCFPSQKTLAKELKRSVRTVQRCLENLVACGYLVVTRIKKGLVNLYTVLNKVKFKSNEKANKVANNIKKKCHEYSRKSKAASLKFNNFKAREIYSNEKEMQELEWALLGWSKDENKKAIHLQNE